MAAVTWRETSITGKVRKWFSRAVNRRVTGDAAPIAIAMSDNFPSSTVARTATMQIEMTRYLRVPSLRKLPQLFGEHAGICIAVTNSSSARSVLRTPSKKSPRGSRRVIRAVASSTSAPRDSNGGTPSAAGDALHRLPAIVPTFWIWIDPTSRAACFSPLNAAGRSAFTISVQVVAAPIVHPSFVRVMPRSSDRREISSKVPRNCLSPCAGNQSVPPAITDAGPAASLFSASSSVVAVI